MHKNLSRPFHAILVARHHDKVHNIIGLWTHAFHQLPKALRRASFAFPLALEHLQDFIYLHLPNSPRGTLKSFCPGWLEALGDLVCYRVAISTMDTSNCVVPGAY